MNYKLLLILIVSTLLGGCCTSRKIAATERRAIHDSVVCVSSLVDTVIEKDSVWVTTETRRDTVYKTEVHERVRWRMRELRDTVRVLLRDSVTKTETQEQGTMQKEQGCVRATVRGMLSSMALALVAFIIWRWRSGKWK